VNIATHYSHLNGLEFLLVHKLALWEEIKDVIAGCDATLCRTKVSKEKRTKGRIFYSPPAMNTAMRRGFERHKWKERRIAYWVTSDAKLIRKTLFMEPDQQKAEIEAAQLKPFRSYNQTDFVKD
jgi:hypothetical protein